MESRRRNYTIALCLLSLIGMGVSIYLIYQHYKPAGGSFCNVSDYVSCDVVNKSKYAEIAGIPISVLGLAAYSFIFLLSFGILRRWIRKNGEAFLVIFTAASVIFSLYLTFVEFFILQAVCLFCITSQTLIIIIFILSLLLWHIKFQSRRLS